MDFHLFKFFLASHLFPRCDGSAGEDEDYGGDVQRPPDEEGQGSATAPHGGQPGQADEQGGTQTDHHAHHRQSSCVHVDALRRINPQLGYRLGARGLERATRDRAIAWITLRFSSFSASIHTEKIPDASDEVQLMYETTQTYIHTYCVFVVYFIPLIWDFTFGT